MVSDVFFLNFDPDPWVLKKNLTIMFFRWVVQPPTRDSWEPKVPPPRPPPPRNKALIRPYEGKPMVNSPLIRPAIYWGKRSFGGKRTLGSHDKCRSIGPGGFFVCAKQGIALNNKKL